MADLGCSSGPNTLIVISEAVETINKTCQKFGRKTPGIQIYLNDLPSNDFNSIFKSLPSFQAQMRDQIGTGFTPYFVNGVPGSFYGRLFPSRSIHFVHSSYILHWLSQKKVLSLTSTIREQAIKETYCSTLPITFCMADLGCSSGPNTLIVISEAVETINKTCQKFGRKTPEIQIYLNDLPSNDFNSIFKSLPSFQAQMRDQIGTWFTPCFVNGVPGSFYGRLFPSRSIHFVHSSYSLHWLSQVPKGIETNGRNIYISKGSPQSVLQAYNEQFQADFSRFLKCRSEEIVEGGRMVLTFCGRISNDPKSKECTLLWDILAMALNEMVREGLMKKEMIDSFNIPYYTPCPAEINSVVKDEGSFVVDHFHVTNVNWCASRDSPMDKSKEDGYSFAKCMRAVVEPLLATKFELYLLEEVFRRYEKKIVEQMMKETSEHTNVTVSLRRLE